jgi:hypothetical protein
MRELEDLKLWARESANAIIYSKANALDKLHLVAERISASRAAVAQSYDLLTRIDNHVTTPRHRKV